ncbi:DUF2178 domain-containing protein [Patescibacteria group bacterium]
METDKKRLIVMAIVTILLLATVSLYGFQVVSNREINPGSIIAFAIPILAVIFMIFFITRRYRDIKYGMPLEDERSRKVMTNAAAKAFYISLYWLLVISWFESSFANMFGVEHLDAGQTAGGSIAGMAIAWFACWLYYNRKGQLN